ncbi:Putative metallophosphoesterase At3g03305 [Linum perenne]
MRREMSETHMYVETSKESRFFPNFNSMMNMTFILCVYVVTVASLLVAGTAGTDEQLISSQPEQWKGRVIDVEKAGEGPESVVWVVQLSDLHFSVHYPERALDFISIIGPTLGMISPSLVLITGDLTDGKSKDMMTMKQDEVEWLEYMTVMEEVVKKSGLDKSIFYDLRGNHDSFGVPAVGGSFDFFSNYSINGQLNRTGKVNSVTLETLRYKLLFVGLDTAMSTGLRGPTNLFGHPTDDLLNEVDSQLSQWDSQPGKPVIKIPFGHFPLSFSALSQSKRSLEDIFLKHSVSAYLCGHLHTRFGKNLKRHHQVSDNSRSLRKFFQLNMHSWPSESAINCSFGASTVNEFWEWEMGDWRKSRAMRILAVDRGHVSYMDMDLMAGRRKTIVMPTFPLDSRFMLTSSSRRQYVCQHMVPSSFETVRALVFSSSPILSVVVRIYDSKPGTLEMVMETAMTKISGEPSRADFYAAPWNYRAFEDPSPDRFLLQIEAIDVMDRSTVTEIIPFSINGATTQTSWTWREFYVMGCQWDALYYPILLSIVSSMLSALVIPKVVLIFSKRQYSYKNFVAGKGYVRGTSWVFLELCKLPLVWFGILTYVIYLIVCPWFLGQVFAYNEKRGYMTYMGWVVEPFNQKGKHEYIGSPDVMVIVLPHLIFVVMPTIFVAGAFVAERSVYKEHFLSLSGKKEDDVNSQNIRKSKLYNGRRWMRKLLLVAAFAIFFKHIASCRILMKAFEMNPLIHFPVYCIAIPLLLAYTIYRTREI